MINLFKQSLWFCCLILFTATSLANYAPVFDNSRLTPAPKGQYIVRDDDTLYSIAWGFGIDFRELAALNRLSPPYAIHTGQLLMLTGETLAKISPPVAAEKRA